MHESGVKCEQRRRVEAEPFLSVQKQVAEEHVDTGRQPPHDSGSLGKINGNRNRSLAPVVGLKRRIDLHDPGCFSGLTGTVANGVSSQRLDLDHVGS